MNNTNDNLMVARTYMTYAIYSMDENEERIEYIEKAIFYMNRELKRLAKIKRRTALLSKLSWLNLRWKV